MKAAIALAAVALASCGEGGSEGSPAAPEPAAIRLMTILVSHGSGNPTIGEPFTLSATGLYSDGRQAPVAVLWTATNPGVLMFPFSNAGSSVTAYGLAFASTQVIALSLDSSIFGMDVVQVMVNDSPQPTILTPCFMSFTVDQVTGFEFECLDYGFGPATWTLSAGSLPPGLSLDEATGLLSGTTPAVIEDGSFTLTATTSGGSDTQEFRYSVYPGPLGTP